MHGTALLMPAGFLRLTGMALGGWSLLPLCIGIFVALAGPLCVYHGFHHHEAAKHSEKQD